VLEQDFEKAELLDDEMFMFVLQHDIPTADVLEMLLSDSRNDFIKLKRLLYND